MSNLNYQEKHENLVDLIEKALIEHGDKAAFHSMGKTLTFKQINEQSKALAAWLQHNTDLTPGDRIVIQLPNIMQFPIAVYAALRAGLILVNTNPMYTTREMLHQFKDSGAKALIIFEDLLPKFDEISKQFDFDVIITASGTRATNLEFPSNNKQVCFEQVIAQGRALPFKAIKNNQPDSICVLQYTGGTTGVSKGAMLTQKNILSNVEQVKSRLGDTCISAEETFVCPLPLYHIYGFVINLLVMFSRGVLSILIVNPRDLDALVKTIKPYKVNGFAGLNTLFVALCQHSEFKSLDFSSLRLTISGGTALTPAAVKQWKGVTNCEISEGYGLSETSPVVCLNSPDKVVYGSVGLPVCDCEVELRDENNLKVNRQERGEILVRGPQVMKGYWNRPEETDKVMTNDGFFRTGDIGICLPSGCIQIVERLKDMINVSGFNVYPNEIEAVLVDHPNILEAAVIGKADEKTGEKVVCFITINGELTTAQVQQHCRESLTGYKVPKEIHIMSELPKSSVGKILRRNLR